MRARAMDRSRFQQSSRTLFLKDDTAWLYTLLLSYGAMASPDSCTAELQNPAMAEVVAETCTQSGSTLLYKPTHEKPFPVNPQNLINPKPSMVTGIRAFVTGYISIWAARTLYNHD